MNSLQSIVMASFVGEAWNAPVILVIRGLYQLTMHIAFKTVPKVLVTVTLMAMLGFASLCVVNHRLMVQLLVRALSFVPGLIYSILEEAASEVGATIFGVGLGPCPAHCTPYQVPLVEQRPTPGPQVGVVSHPPTPTAPHDWATPFMIAIAIGAYLRGPGVGAAPPAR